MRQTIKSSFLDTINLFGRFGFVIVSPCTLLLDLVVAGLAETEVVVHCKTSHFIFCCEPATLARSNTNNTNRDGLPVVNVAEQAWALLLQPGHFRSRNSAWLVGGLVMDDFANRQVYWHL